MPSRLHRIGAAFFAVLAIGSARAVPFPDEFVGPPSYSLMGCPMNEEWTVEVVQKVLGYSDTVLRRVHNRFGFTPERICGADPGLMAGMLVNASGAKHRFDEPDKALAQRAEQMRDENGQIPPNALLDALHQREQLMLPKKAGLEKSAGLSSGGWTWIGPGNIGGRVRAISPHPTSPGEILIGSVSGGIWRTTNSGTTWTVVNDFLPNVAISCLIRDPAQPATIYACTGEGVFNIDAVRGLGLFKSVNNGSTWTQVASTNPATAGNDWYYVNRLAVSPTNSLVMLAATNGGVYRTSDGGTSWTKVYEAVGTPTNPTSRWRSVQDIAFHPTDGNVAVLGESQHINCSSGSCVIDGNGVAHSADGGVSWTRTKLNTSAIPGSSGRVEIAIARSSPNIVYAVVDMNTSGGTVFGQLYKSTDGGATWPANAPVSTPGHLFGQGWYNNAIWVAPNDPNRLIVGGVNQKMSIDGGATFATLSNTVHVDHHAYASDPNYASNFTIYNGNDGGVYKATGLNTATPGTSSPTWTNLNNGLGITQFYGAAGKDGGRITGGTQDNGTLLWTGSTNWVRIWGSDGGNSAADQVDGNYVYGMTQYGGVVRYTQALSASPPANASQYICTGITDASCNFNNASPKILFIPPVVIDTTTNTTLYLGAQQLWRSTNIKHATNTSVAWSVVKTAIGGGAYISEVAIAPGNPDIVWIGYQNGSLACSTNATQATPTWTTVSGGASRYVSRIFIDPSNYNRVYVANTGYSSPNLRRTTNGCTSAPTWTLLHNQLPVAPIRAILQHPNNPQWLYAGTEVGLFTSENDGASWTTTNDGPGTVSVEELFWLNSTTLVAATHGRGMFTATVVPGGAPTITSSPPFNGTINVPYSHAYTANGSPAPTFGVTAGTLPTGLSLNGTTGSLSGAPTVAGTFNGTVTATNTSGTATQDFLITIGAATPGAPVIGSATPGNGQASISFSPPASTGGSAITSYTATCNPGSRTGTGAASPITVGSLTNGTVYTCSVTATNSAGTGPASGSVTVTPTNAAPPSFTSAAPVGGTAGSAYSHTFAAAGTPAPTFSLTAGGFPTGLSLNGTSGALTGTPSVAGTFTGTVTATNANGSATQNFSIAIAAVVPGAPTIVGATPGNGLAIVSFSPPAFNGGAAITGYTATCNPGSISGSGASSPITVNGLINETTYTCSARAINSAGTGPASGTATVTPTSNVAPAWASSPPGGGTFGVAYSHTFVASGSPTPTYSVFSGTLPSGLTLNQTSGVLTGTPSASGTFTGVMRATNGAGNANQNFSITIAATVPGAPGIVSATPGNAQASIAFTVPASTGGAAITSYTATCTPGNISGSGAASPVTVSGLSNGTTYSCSVRATNSVGQGSASGSVNVTPGVAPSFTSGAAPGGTFGVGYSHTFTASGVPAPSFALASGSLPAGLSLASGGAVTGTPTVAGTFNGSVTATNSMGTAVQAFSIVIAGTLPGAPTIGIATPASGQATISFTPPASNGGSAITSYTVTCTPANKTASGPGSPITVTTLNDGTTYSCSVRATNSTGQGPASASVSVTPGAGPVFTSAAAPAGTFGVAYSHTFIAGGTPPPTYSLLSGTLPTGLALDASTGALSGTPSAAGTFTGTIRATNSAGVASQNFSIAIAATVPGAPLIGSATPGNAQASISFTPPASNGGSAITGYTATCNPGNISGSGAGSPLIVPGLSNGVTYSCSVRANNAIGSSAASGSVNVTPGGGPAFTSAAAPGGTFGVAYSHTFAATGSPVPTFALASGVLPPGLTLNGTTGVLAGTPVEAGTFTGIINASNALGTASQAFAITIAPTLPGAPTIGSASPGSNSAVISFTPPASNGGSPITGYTVTCNPGNKTGTGSASPVTVMQLANSTTYTCAVRAENAAGLGPSSGTVTVTPGNVSSGGTAPSFSSPAPSPGTFGVPYSHTFVASGTPAPTFSVSFGSLPTGLTLNPATGALTGTPTEVGSFSGEITAASSSGFATQLFDIPISALVPSAPTLDGATPGDSQATFAFTAPISNGGAPITSYTVICNPGNANAAAAASPITVGGVANGTTYTCAVRAFNSAGGSPASNSLTVTPAPVVVNPARLGNISTRLRVLTGNDVMIGGFVIGGNATKTVVIRAIGPSLANFGVAGTLANPTMQIVRMSDQSTIATNDDWANAPNAADLAASGFAPSDPRESAVLITLGPGAYSAIVSGVGGSTGVGIVEVYEVDAPTVPLINISTRGQVRTGFDQMIGGFVVQGTGRQKVVIRAIGPSLANFGISGTLPNPVMQLVRLADQATIATNDDWGSASNAAEIIASGFAPSNPLEATILITLDPGAYTVIISGSGGSTGVGIFEVYTVP